MYLESQKSLEGDNSGMESPVVLGRNKPAVANQQLERNLKLRAAANRQPV